MNSKGRRSSRVLRLDPGIAFHFAGPLQEAKQLHAFAPSESKKFEETDAMHLDTGVGFNPPAQIGAAPGGEAMAAGRVPQEAQDVMHRCNQYIGDVVPAR